MQMHHLEILRQLKQCSKLSLPSQGKKLHARVTKSGFDLHGPLYANRLIDMYGKCGLLEDAVHMFDETPQRDLASWASIFTAYNQASRPRHSLFLFKDMLSRDGFQPDDFIMASLVKASASLAELRLGLQLHAQFVVSPFSDDDVVKSSLVDFYAKCGLPDEARKVFDSVVLKNVVTWTSLMFGYAKIGRKDEAVEILHSMPCKNVYSCTALISGLVQSGNYDAAVSHFNAFRREGKYVTEPFILSNLIVGSSGLAMLELGKQLHKLVLGYGYEANPYIGNALVDMYSKCCDVVSAEKTFNSMTDKDVVSWTSIIVGMAHHGRAEEALSMYDKMTLAGLKPNLVTFTGIIYACSHAGLIEKGKQLFKSMVEDYKLKPSLQHYTCLIDLYARSGCLEEAESVINSMPFKPDEAVWASLLSACCQNERKETGVRIANHLLRLGPEDPSTCILMSNIYARASMWESVSTVRKLMAGTEFKKKPGYSCVNLGRENEVFYAGETTAHPLKDRIYVLLKKLDAEMRKRGYVPDTSVVLHDMEHQEKERQLFWHSERLALAYGLLKSVPGTTIRIIKNLRVCSDCHTVFKFICTIAKREIVVRDANRFHHFKDGKCSCGDFW